MPLVHSRSRVSVSNVSGSTTFCIGRSAHRAASGRLQRNPYQRLRLAWEVVDCGTRTLALPLGRLSWRTPTPTERRMCLCLEVENRKEMEMSLSDSGHTSTGLLDMEAGIELEHTYFDSRTRIIEKWIYNTVHRYNIHDPLVQRCLYMAGTNK